MTTFKLDELAFAAEVAPRTVRYYVQRGLLPAPAFHGKDTRYDTEHLARLRAIKRLQQRHLPLDEIQARLAGASPAEIERIASETHEDAVTGGRDEATARRDGPYRTPVDMHRASLGERSSPSRGFEHGRRPRAEKTPEPDAWERFVLAPGVELHVRTGSPHDARALAHKIRTELLPSRN